MNMPDREIARRQDRFGPVIASGTQDGVAWELRGRIDDSESHSGVWWWHQGSGGGGGGSGGGGLPFGQSHVGHEVVNHRHFGGYSGGSGRHTDRSGHRTLRRDVHGVVSTAVASVDVELEDGSTVRALVVDTGDPRARVFVGLWTSAPQWSRLVARDTQGTQLEVLDRPPDLMLL
jgi:hypothetical protein